MSDRGILYLLVLLSGAVALAWEVLWQLETALALGASAWGAALTLAVTFGGMSAGSAWMGARLRAREGVRPLRLYGALQAVIGAAGLALGPAFRALESLDTGIYARAPAAAALLHAAGLAAVLGVPAFCMGATLPALGLAARRSDVRLSRLYGINTLGAAAGTLLAAFALLPALGVAAAAVLLAAVNFTVAIAAALADRAAAVPEPAPSPAGAGVPPAAVATVCVTGFAMFALEVVWFRALVSAFKGTTDAFAVMLACVLLSLGAAAAAVPGLRRRGVSLPMLLAAAGAAILLSTPLVERLDLVVGGRDDLPLRLIAQWSGLTLLTIGPPTFLLGLALPWLLDGQSAPRSWAVLYSANTLAAVAGALGAGWLLLPAIGLARTAWLAGGLVAAAGIVLSPARRRWIPAAPAAAALLAAMAFESGLGTVRAQSGVTRGPLRPVRVLESFDGPDATYAAVETAGGDRMLLINGFITSVQMGAATEDRDPTHYMRWMGHLPMLLHPDPRRALVICFGIGLTAQAVRVERPLALDVVDLSARVFGMADHFPANEGVLRDPAVRPIVMDGRAWLRRTPDVYDVITLEPMPPNFAGSNALYSREFYEAAARRLGPDGILAQWLPLHLVPPDAAVAIARTFLDVLPNSMLWVDPRSGTGILVGSKDVREPIGARMPGYGRDDIPRSLSEAEVRGAFALNPAELAHYAANGGIVTDDNQLLAYGRAVLRSHHQLRRLRRENQERLEAAAGRSESPR